jgi:predicted peroxiredoxin
MTGMSTPYPATGPATARPLVVKLTCGAEAAERANQAWTVAAMAVAAGAPVTVWLTGEGVWFAVPGRQPDLDLPHASAVADLVETVRAGGQIVVCTQCAARRGLVATDLVDSASIAGAASFVEVVLAPDVQALVY